MSWQVILLALAMMLVLEGIGPMLFPNRWQGFLKQLAEMPGASIQTYGGVLVTIGLVLLYFLW